MLTSDLTGFRLSPQQEDLWHAQGARPAAGFVCQGRLEIDGPLDRGRLRHAVERVVERHEILRTVFPLLSGMSLPIQVIRERGNVLWTETTANSPDGEEAVERLLAEARQSPLGGEEGPALQAALLSFGEERHTLVLTLPALAADPLSLRLLAREVATLYGGGEGAGALPEPLQYADAAETLQEWRGPEDGPGASFWRQQEAAAAETSGLPAAAALPGTVRRRLPAEPAAALAGALGVPLPRLLLAGWSAALWSETGEERSAVAVAVDGRTFDELTQAVGLYARYLPLLAVTAPHLTLGDLARSLAEAEATAAGWQDAFSLGRLAAGPAGDSTAAAWPCGFDSDSAAVFPPPGLDPGLSPSFTWQPAFAGLGRFGLRLSVIEPAAANGAEIRLDLHYDPARHDRGQAGRLLDRLERVLSGTMASPETPLGEIDLLTAAERREILSGFNDTAAPYPAAATVCDLFADQVRRTPGSPAVIAGGARLTFSELDAQAERLACRLRALGIGPEARVGIHLERGVEMVVALLAVLKAGGAYVPFDAGHPAERLRFLMADARLAALVTREGLRPEWAAGMPIVLVGPGSADAEAVARQSAGPLARLAGPGNAAYVIYTSGSTGRPKGVVVTHRGLVNYLCWARTTYTAGSGEVAGRAPVHAPVHSPLGFDLTVTSLFVPLLTGAAVTLLPEEDGIGALAAALSAGSFGLAKITPAHLGLLRRLAPEGEPPPSAACLVIGGDALRGADIAPWRGGGTRIFNEYGPTETVVGCCVHEVDAATSEPGAVPIGRPIANTRLYVLGPGLRPVPAGVPGELWIGGDGVARGYLDRPALTAERFAPDPFALPEQAGSRLYRTGDLVRLVRRPAPRATLELEFLGRIDDQVKIRGHRVEPGETAAALIAHPGLRDAAVAAQGEGDDRRLVAWVVPRDRARRPSATELRGFLAGRLPEPMIPSLFVDLDVLPLTANGKLDRRALPEPALQRDEAAPYAPPRTLVEEILAEVWSQVLGVDRVGIDDPFFSLGGDSIRSIQVISLAQKRGVSLTLQDVFQRPTIRALGETVRLAIAATEGAVERCAPFSLLSPADRAILPNGLDDAYPLARLQSGMLFHSEHSPESAIFNDQHSFHLRGRLDPGLLRRAVGALILRHAALRTSFDFTSFSEPLQLVHSGTAAPITFEELTALDGEAQEETIAAWLEADRHRAWDWSLAPLARFHVHIRSPATFQMTLSFHHSILDGWSAASLLSELFRLHARLLAGAPSKVEDEQAPAAAFSDFIRLERAALAAPQDAAFWRRYLKGIDVSPLPRWRPAGDHRRSRVVAANLPADTVAGLRAVARATAAPFKSVLLAAHCKVVGFLTGRTEVLTGLSSNGRSEQAESEQALGVFLNNVPFRQRLGQETWEDLARAVFANELDLMPHRRFPLADIQAAQGGRALFESAFNFLHYHVYKGLPEIAGVEVLGIVGYEETDFPLIANFYLDPQGSAVGLLLNFSEAQIAPAQAEAITGAYLAALAAMSAEPGRRHAEVSLLSAAEQHARLYEWGWGAGVSPAGAWIHEQIHAQTLRSPSAAALQDPERSLAYAELRAAVGRLAGHLHRRGVRLDTPVAVALDRSVDLPVALLSVLTAGGAYLPLDSGQPRERLAQMLQGSGARFLVTSPRFPGQLPALPGLTVIDLERDREALAAEPPEAPAVAISGNNLAYVLYTSGSTGTPKGVMVPHRGLANYLGWAASAYPVREGCGAPVHSPIGFDLTVTSLFLPLLTGGCVHLLPEDGELDGLANALTAGGFGLVKLTPAHLKALAGRLGTEAVAAATRSLIVGGEALLGETLKSWQGPRIFNEYGPTETVVGCSVFEQPAGRPLPERVPIGRPVANTRLLLLDTDFQSVPLGAPGEIWIAGVQVARGYLGRPDLTAERFLPDPAGLEPGARAYRTGDLARHRPDGVLEYLGRSDSQVKVRGYRIELGEIEAVLSACPAVEQAAVLPCGEAHSETRLAAYVVLRGSHGAAEVRDWLAERLPEPMIPREVIELAALPLTSNGKVDRAALSAPGAARPPREHGWVAPRGPIEEVLAAIWGEVLHVEGVGAEDSFFELGGDSITSLQISTRARRAGLALNSRLVLQHPTVAAQAAQAAVALRSGALREMPPIVPAPRDPAPPLSFAQQRLWFLDQLDPGSPVYNIPAAIVFSGDLDRTALAAAFAAVAARHEALRTTFYLSGEEPLQRIAPPRPVPLPLIDLTALPPRHGETEVRRLAREDALRPFDLRRGPLLRLALVRLAEGEHALLLNVHHIIADGWSLDILIREIAAFYASHRAGRPVSPPLPRLPIQYADYAAWQRRWTSSEVLDGLLGYWRERLAGAPLVLELPADRPRPLLPSGRGEAATLLVPAAQAARIAALARREGATLFMALLSVFGALLHRYTAREDVLVGTDVANRDRVETEGLIGFFINQLVLRLDLAGSPPFVRLLERVREVALGAYSHGDLPFERLVEELQPQRDLSRNPVFQIAFAVQAAPAAFEVPGLSLHPLGTGSGVARFDFLVVASEAAGGGIWLRTEHSADLFDDTTAARLLGHMAGLLAAAAASPERPIAEQPLLAAAEQHQVLIEWNDSAAALPWDESTFVALFSACANACPDRIAVADDVRTLTYRELDQRSGILAAILIQEEVKAGDVIPLLAARSTGFLAAMIAIFKAGAVYLPLDPVQPPARWAQILQDCGAAVVLCEKETVPALALATADRPAPRLLVLEELLARDRTEPAPPLQPGEPGLAYVIYTSGSTGVPKGALVEHRGMLNHLWAKISALGLTAADTVAQTASQSFDISVWQLLAPLLTGGGVRIYSDEVVHDPLRLIGAVGSDGVTILETVPSLLGLLVGELAAQQSRPSLARLRWLIPTGETLPPGLCRQWLDLYPAVPLLNAYGPTECSDDVTHHAMTAAPSPESVRTPIGRPVPNLRLYVLDRLRQPQPAGVTGEICIGGAGVGRGYLGAASTTAEAWLPDPFAGEAEPGARLYCTGDLGRRLADGTVELLGRADHQVKIRGHRLELGEIESVLASCPEVLQSAVSVREDAPGDRRLVAYVVPRAGHREADTAKVGQWQTVFDEVYHLEAVSPRDGAVHLRVWIDSFTGRPLPEDEILECVESSVARLLELRPSRVLEIGCGSGLLLERIAPGCAEYWGTDVSAEVLGSLERRLAGRPGLPVIHLLQRAADDFAGIPEGTFDTVILNEVVQYFPSGDYLVTALDRAVAAAAPGGVVFVGGVRSLPLLEAFAAAVEIRHLEDTAADHLPLPEVRERIRRRLDQEKELLVDPELFVAMARRAGLRGVEIQLKGGRAHNELTRYRYDVVLRKKGSEGLEIQTREDTRDATLEWSEMESLDGLRRRLEACPGAALRVNGIPNARLVQDLADLVLLRAEPEGTLGTLRAARRRPLRRDGVEPEDLWHLGRELDRRTEVRWEGGGELLTVSFSRRGAARPPQTPTEAVEPASWSRWTNHPARGLIAEGLVPRLRAHLSARLPEAMIPAVFVLLDALPLTPNGKLDRRALPTPDQARPELGEEFVPPSHPVEETLARIWREVLRLDRIGARDNFFHLGGDSILSIQVVSRANQAGLRLTPRQIFQHQTIAELAAVVGTASTMAVEQGAVTGELPLTPIQHWFFAQRFADPQHWNQSLLLTSREHLDRTHLARALALLVAHHDALRLRFPGAAAGQPRQILPAPGGEVPLTVLDLAGLPETRRRYAVEAAAGQLHTGLDLERGPIVRAALHRLGTGSPERLHLVIHHLAIDGLSWQILLSDLEATYRALARGEAPALPPKTLSYKSWAELLAAHARSPQLVAELDRWIAAGLQPGRLPVDKTAGANTVGSADLVTAALSEEETVALLQEIPPVYRTQINDALLSALARTLARWTGRRRVLLELEGHGREELFEGADLSRTVGWFTSEFPLLLELTVAGDPGADLKVVKEQLRALPQGGVGYGLLRYLGEEDSVTRLAALPAPEILFNYHGQADSLLAADSLFVPAPEPNGSPQSLRSHRSHLLEVNSWIAEGCLRLSWAYSRNFHRRTTIEDLAHRYLGELRALIDHCRAPQAGGFTPSDFAGARLNQRELDKFLSRIGE